MKKIIASLLCVFLLVGICSPTLLPTAEASTWYTKLFTGSDRGGDFGGGGFGGGQRGGWGSSSSGIGLSPTEFGFSEISYQTLSDLVVSINNDWIVAGVYHDLFGTILYNAKIRYNSSAGYYYIIAYSDVTNKVYSYTDNAGNLYIAHKDAASTPEVNVDVSVSTTTFDDTDVLTALYGIWQTMLLQVDCQLITAESVLTDAQVNLAAVTRLDDVVTPMLENIVDWNSGLYSLVSILVDDFSDLQNLYGTLETLTISSGDVLQWDSSLMQEPSVTFASSTDSSVPIYSCAAIASDCIPSFDYCVFTLTPSTGTYFSQTIDVGGVSIDMPSHVVSTAVPNPAHVVPDGYTQYEYIQSTGTQWIDTGRAFSMGDVYNIHLSDYPHVKAYNNIWGSYKSASGLANCRKNLRTYDTKFRFTDGTAIFLNFVDSANGDNSIVINYGTDGNLSVVANGTNVGTGAYSASSMSMYLFNVNGIDTGVPASIRLYSYSVTNSGTLSYNLVPCANPSGEVGMYDTVSGSFFPNAGSGTFLHGSEVLPSIGEDVVEQYLISFIYRGEYLDGYFHWYGVDSGGTTRAFSAADCAKLDAVFLPTVYQSIDDFIPQDGSFLIFWDDAQTGKITISYQAMSKFFCWIYRYLDSQRDWVMTTVVPALQNSGDNVSQSINTTINNVTVNNDDTFFNVFDLGGGDNIVSSGVQGANHVGSLFKWLWNNTFKQAFSNAHLNDLNNLIE